MTDEDEKEKAATAKGKDAYLANGTKRTKRKMVKLKTQMKAKIKSKMKNSHEKFYPLRNTCLVNKEPFISFSFNIVQKKLLGE